MLCNLASLLELRGACDEELPLIDSAYKLALSTRYACGTAMAYWRYATRSIACKRDYNAASVYFKKVVAIIDANKLDFDPRIENLMHFQILNHFFLVGDFTYAIELVTKRLQLYEGINDRHMIAHYNSLLGFIFLREARIAEAKKYYSIYLREASALNDSCFLADACNCAADVFVAEKKYDSALVSCFSALEIYRLLTTRPYARLNKTMTKWERIAFTEYKAGNIYKLKHNNAKARDYTLVAIDRCMRRHGGDPYDIASYYINAGDIYKELKEYHKALNYLDTGLSMSREMSHSENIRDAYNYIAQTYSQMGKYDSAFAYNLLYEKLKDSIGNENTGREIERIHAGYNLEKKDNEILLLSKEKKLTEATVARQKQTQYIVISSSVLLLLILALLYNRRQLRQKTKFQTELKLQRNEWFNTVLTVQEKERKRIAQDLHDSLGSILSAAKLKLSELEAAQPLLKEQDGNYATAMSLLDEAASELRNISHNIMPATLSKVGLIAALKSLFSSISNTGLVITFSAYGFDKRVNEEMEVSIYRIILELVNNVVRHAHASQVVVQIIKHPEMISINVEDNGTGFDVEKALKKASGIGLNNITTRVEYLKGTVDFDMPEGKGTTVLINIPRA